MVVARVLATLVTLVVLAGALWATRRVLHSYARRAGRRTLMRARVRIDRYKLTRKAYVIDALLADEAIADAGAYGFTMASQYNSHELPAEIAVNASGHQS